MVPCDFKCVLCANVLHCGPFRINYVAGCLYLSATRNFRNSSFNGPTKPTLLFVSYFLLFITNYYFGFMIGLFSFLYYFARTFTDWQRYKSRIVAYFTTSLLAGGASMIMVLPAVLDYEPMVKLFLKLQPLKQKRLPFRYYYEKYDWRLRYNQIWVHSFYLHWVVAFDFLSLLFRYERNSIEKQTTFGSLFVLLISFYITPLNLFWHGMHAPNMFLFRYSFLFSFLLFCLLVMVGKNLKG